MKIPWDVIDEIPYRDYQLFIVMHNAWSLKQKAEQGGEGEGTSFADPEALAIQGGFNQI